MKPLSRDELDFLFKHCTDETEEYNRLLHTALLAYKMKDALELCPEKSPFGVDVVVNAAMKLWEDDKEKDPGKIKESLADS